MKDKKLKNNTRKCSELNCLHCGFYKSYKHCEYKAIKEEKNK